MAENISTLNIYQKLAKIRKPVEVLKKDSKAYNYNYVKEEVILAKITGLMEKFGVSLIPSIVPQTTVVTPYHYVQTKVTAKGEVYENHINEILVKFDMEWHWVNNENPTERIIVPWAAVGQQDDASQALGSGLSYSSRYFLLKYFNVATSDDDPDAWRSRQKEAEESEGKEVAKEIIARVHTVVADHLTANPDDRDKVSGIVKKYAVTKTGKPSANYHDITDPEKAAALLKDLQTNFKKEK